MAPLPSNRSNSNSNHRRHDNGENKNNDYLQGPPLQVSHPVNSDRSGERELPAATPVTALSSEKTNDNGGEPEYTLTPTLVNASGAGHTSSRSSSTTRSSSSSTTSSNGNRIPIANTQPLPLSSPSFAPSMANRPAAPWGIGPASGQPKQQKQQQEQLLSTPNKKQRRILRAIMVAILCIIVIVATVKEAQERGGEENSAAMTPSPSPNLRRTPPPLPDPLEWIYQGRIDGYPNTTALSHTVSQGVLGWEDCLAHCTEQTGHGRLHTYIYYPQQPRNNYTINCFCIDGSIGVFACRGEGGNINTKNGQVYSRENITGCIQDDKYE